MLHMPVGIRSLSLAILAVLASVFALQWAKAVVIPILLGLMFSYALTPVVDRLARWRLPRAAGAGLVIIAIIVGLVWGGWSMRDDADAFIESLPSISLKLRQIVQRPGAMQVGTIARMQQAATEISRAAEGGPAASASAPPASATRVDGRGGAITTTTTTVQTTQPAATRVVVEQSPLNISSYLWTGTVGLFSFLGQTAIVLLVTFFLLATGNTFRRKMVKLAGPKFSQKKLTIEALDEITGQIQRYLLVQIATSVVVGVATGLAFFALGLDHAAVWGVVAGITNLIPYIGAIIVGAGSTLIGLLQFGSIQPALLVGISSFAIHAVVGNLLTPWLTGRASQMSPFAVFVGVLAFGWLWGAVGLILGVPILMAIKTVCDRVEELKPVGEFLGA
ncbi:MAG: AI-2E family transporter [Caldimonas sp.]